MLLRGTKLCMLQLLNLSQNTAIERSLFMVTKPHQISHLVAVHLAYPN